MKTNAITCLVLSQLLVLLLLFAILFVFAVFPSDPADADSPPSRTSSNVWFFDQIQQIDLPPADNHSSSTDLTTRQRRSPQGRQKLLIKGEIATGPSRRREEVMEDEASSLHFHPCHYLQLASVAFLKCFGLDSSSDSPSARRNRKRKES